MNREQEAILIAEDTWYSIRTASNPSYWFVIEKNKEGKLVPGADQVSLI